MTQEEMDKLIADAVAESKAQSKWHRPTKKGGLTPDQVKQARRILNMIFMIGFVATIIIYFLVPEQKVLFFSIGFGAMVVKILEFVLRFMF